MTTPEQNVPETPSTCTQQPAPKKTVDVKEASFWDPNVIFILGFGAIYDMRRMIRDLGRQEAPATIARSIIPETARRAIHSSARDFFSNCSDTTCASRVGQRLRLGMYLQLAKLYVAERERERSGDFLIAWPSESNKPMDCIIVPAGGHLRWLLQKLRRKIVETGIPLAMTLGGVWFFVWWCSNIYRVLAPLVVLICIILGLAWKEQGDSERADAELTQEILENLKRKE